MMDAQSLEQIRAVVRDEVDERTVGELDTDLLITELETRGHTVDATLGDFESEDLVDELMHRGEWPDPREDEELLSTLRAIRLAYLSGDEAAALRLAEDMWREFLGTAL